MKNSAILLVSCPDAKGEVARIADFVYRHGGNILHADEHADEESGLFLMRVEFDPQDFDIDLTEKGLADFAKHFSPIAESFQMTWRLAQSSYRPRMIILVWKSRSLPGRSPLPSPELRTRLRHSAYHLQSR